MPGAGAHGTYNPRAAFQTRAWWGTCVLQHDVRTVCDHVSLSAQCGVMSLIFDVTVLLFRELPASEFEHSHLLHYGQVNTCTRALDLSLVGSLHV